MTAASRPRQATLVALAFQGALLAVALSVPGNVVPPSSFALAPAVLALTAPDARIPLVAATGSAFALGFGFVLEDTPFTIARAVSIGGVALIGVLSTLLARDRLGAAAERDRADRARDRAEAEARRLGILADLARVAEGGTDRDHVLTKVGDLLHPAVADRLWIELAPDGPDAAGPPAPDVRMLQRGDEVAGGGDELELDLRAGGRRLGVIGIATARSLDVADEQLMRTLAARIALVLDNAALVSALRSSRERLDATLGALAEAVTVQDQGGRTVYANAAAVALFGAESAAEVLDAAPGALLARFAITREDGSPVEAAQMPGRQVLRGASEVPPLLSRTVHRASGRERWLVTKATRVQEDDGRVLAVNVFEDVTEAKRTEHRQRILADAARVLGSSLDPDAILSGLVGQLAPGVADRCAVVLTGEDGPVLVASSPPSDALPEAAPEAIRLAAPAIRTEQGRPAVIAAPMISGGSTLGALVLAMDPGGRAFGDDELAFAQDLAGRAAAAVDHGRLYAERASIAETLQRSLLPERLPVVAGWDLHAAYEAGVAATEVGGDFFDVFAVAGGTLVLLGDVTGRGLEAAALTALVRHSVRAAARFDPSPAAVLGVVNAVLRDQEAVAPVTAVCALLTEGAAGVRMAVCSAGHPLPLRRRGADVEPVGHHGMLLGAVDDHGWTATDEEVQPGDVLVFFTDGVTEARGPADRFGVDRLQEAVAAGQSRPESVVAGVLGALEDYALPGQADDRALLVLRRAAA